MQQITVSRVELYQIKTGFTRVSNGLTEIIDDTWGDAANLLI